MAQSTDSLVLKQRILIQEDSRYIQMALRDGAISAEQADSLQKVTSRAVERPLKVSIDILFQIRDLIDCRYEDLMKALNENVMEEYYYTANSMLPSKLEIPADYISPEEREEARRELAMKQMAESIALDFERDKLPAWQIWWRKHVGLFLGNMAWFRRKVTYINGQQILIPQKDDER